MKIVQASSEIVYAPIDALKRIERCARTCYKSEDAIGPGTASKMVLMLRDRGHFAMFDHVSASVRFIVDRGVSHEIVRHRIAAYAQSSTRYCNYSKGKFGGEIMVVDPHLPATYVQLDELMSKPSRWQRLLQKLGLRKAPVPPQITTSQHALWIAAMRAAERFYLDLLAAGAAPQMARSVLPNSIKTEIIATLDFTAWRHFFRMRTSKAAHPQMREVAIPLLAEFTRRWPECFDDIKAEI